MDIQASKPEVIKMILDLEDPKLIKRVHKLLIKEKKDFYDELSEDEKLEVQFGIDQLDRGKSISWEDFKKKRRER